MSLDLVIRNGTLIDGTGAPPITGDLAVKGDRIVAIGKIEEKGETEIDAAGWYVTPGFIDIHSHSDYTLLIDPRAVSAIHQGVTLEVIGNCGFGCGPIRDPALAKGTIYGFDGSIPLSWNALGEYLEKLEQAAPAINVMTLVPNGQLRLSVVGMRDRPANPDELAKMKQLLCEGFNEGAFGYSTGLEYGAERGATKLSFVRCAASCGRPTASTRPTPATVTTMRWARSTRRFAPRRKARSSCRYRISCRG